MQHLRAWFSSRKRALPWRDNPSPYAVWVSEVMLQQTQVAAVLPYFERWMATFPTLKDLADASLEEVIKEWEGLGYYSRARNLHTGAQQILREHGGKIPETHSELIKIKGIGGYTSGAIRSFAFHQKCAAVDGNVLRVLSRFWGSDLDISKPKTRTVMQKRLEAALVDDRPWEIAEALIELGALVCKKKAECDRCPLKGACAAFAKGLQESLPVKSAKIEYQKLYRVALVIHSEGHLLVQRHPSGQVMADLFEFPVAELSSESFDVDKIAQAFVLKITPHMPLDEVRYGFTRFRVRLFPWLFQLDHRDKVEGYQWVQIDELSSLPFSSGHRKVVNRLSRDAARW